MTQQSMGRRVLSKLLQAYQIQFNLRIAVLACPKIQSRGVDFINDWHRKTKPADPPKYFKPSVRHLPGPI